MVTTNGSLLVVGGGVTGVQASLDLAEMGFSIHLVENSPTLGESRSRTAQVSHGDSPISLFYPKIVECARHPRIELHTYSEVSALGGRPRNFNVKILEKPRYVRTARCIGCQACVDKCPAKVLSEVDDGKSARKAIYMASPESMPRVVTIDPKNCLFFTKKICRVCEKFCTSNAIDFDQKPREIELNVAAVVVAALLDGTKGPILPDTKVTGIYYCEHPAEPGSEELEKAVKLGAELAGTVGRDLLDASEVAQVKALGAPPPKGITALVNPAKCNACGACEGLCPSRAPAITSADGHKFSRIDPLRCQGCGICVAGCPRFAITLQDYATNEVLNQVKAALEGATRSQGAPRILMFACKYCGFPVSERSGAWKTDYPENVRVVTLPCSGSLDPFIVAEALRSGADGIIISGCRPAYCHFLTGNMVAEDRFRALEAAMDSLGIDPQRVRLQWISPSEPKPLISFVKEMSEKLAQLEPNPISKSKR